MNINARSRNLNRLVPQFCSNNYTDMVIQTFFLIFLGLSEKFPKTSKWFNDLASHPTYKYAVELLYPGDPKKLLQVSASVRGLLSLSRVIFP